MEDRIINITYDSDKETIFIHRKSGDIEIKEGNELDYVELKERHSFITIKEADEFRAEWKLKYPNGFKVKGLNQSFLDLKTKLGSNPIKRNIYNFLEA